MCIPVVVAVAAAPTVFTACVRPPAAPSGPVITARWADNFDRAQLGADWSPTSTDWTIENGRLHVSNAHNHPLWLRRRLPRNARVEFDATSGGDAGDIKCELYGDGHSQATEASYTATSYVVIFGGWHNQLNVIARMDEHASNRQVRRGPRVVPGQSYHWLVERRGETLTWALDGQPMLEFNDHEPLAGAGHEFFAFNNWEVDLYFDNLVITPL